MRSLKNLFFKLNAWLLIFNAVIIGFVTISNMYVEYKIAQANQSVLGAQVPVFDRNMLLSDTAFRSTRAFPDAASVAQYLTSKNAPIAQYTEQNKTAAQIIFAAARGETSAKWGIVPNLNPGVLIAYLEKEQSLIGLTGYDTAKDTEKRVKYAMGYGCPDGASCNDEYAGFYNQVNWAAYQLEYNYALSLRTDHSDLYKIKSTINTLDTYSVFLSNAATAANYRYTPHVYWGNYNLWKIIISNGWGDSAETFSYAELDAASKPGSTSVTTVPTSVTYADIQDMIATPPALGTSSARVSQLQLFLKDQGTFTYPTITGYYGTITQSALNAYISSPAYKAASTPDECTLLKSKTWSIGQTGNDVRRLQECLIAAGLFDFGGGATGYFGPITQSGLTKWKSVGGGVPAPVPQPVPAPVVQTDLCVTQKQSASNWTIGRVGQDVRDLQQCLKDQGTYTWPNGVTGYFGNYTKGLLGSIQAVSVCEPAVTQAKSWTIGRVGQDVRDLQQCLQDKGIYKWQFGVTGYFGNYTKGILP
jgi:peptidoglycan hydrolase-like protein with peptidoglycan-binding domain